MHYLPLEWLIKAGFFIVLGFFLYPFSTGKVSLKRTSCGLIILFHSIVLAFLTIFFTNEPPLVFGEEVQVLNTLALANNKYSENGYRFVKNNFILIDNSFDKTLIPNPAGTEGDNTSIVITDRKKLSSFFSMVNAEKDFVDLVVCDIGFSDSSPDDTLLRREMDTLFAADKLLISVNGVDDNNPIFHFPAVTCGDTREKTNDFQFVTHTLQRDKYSSLPYKIYSFLTKTDGSSTLLFNRMVVESKGGNISLIGINTFLPVFSMINEAGFADDGSQNNLLPDPNDTVSREGWKMRDLGYILTDDGKQDLQANLRQRKNAGHKNVIFLGSFKGENEDIHKTMYGDLHGTTIILNVLFDLVNKKHAMNWPLMTTLPIVLFVMTASITNAFKKKNDKPIKKVTEKNNIWKLLKEFSGFFLIELHFLILLFFTVCLVGITDRIFNASLLIIYFVVFEIWWNYFKKLKNEKNPE